MEQIRGVVSRAGFQLSFWTPCIKYKASHHIKRLGSFLKGKRGVRGFRVEYINLCPSVWSNATVPPVHHVHSVHIRLSCDHKIHHERPRNCRWSIQGDKNVHKSLAEVKFSVHLSGYHNCYRHSARISGEGICRIGNLAIFRQGGVLGTLLIAKIA